MGIRYRFMTQIEQASPAERAAFYQCRYDGDRIGQLAWMLRILLHRGRDRANGEDLFADYKESRIFDPASVMAELDAADVVSFDVFDTLIIRSVRHPTDVFQKMERKYGVPGFRRRRIEAEKAARERKYGQCGSMEIAIEDIYRVLEMWHLYGDISEEQELEMELHCCMPNPVMQRITESLLAERRKVIAVSDMYLHQGQVMQILRKCGYTGLHGLYVSCDYKASKSDGKLFPAVLQKLGDGKRLIHIGDNFYSDVSMPKGLGIRTMHYIKNKREDDGKACKAWDYGLF